MLPARGLPTAAAPPPSAPQTVPGPRYHHPVEIVPHLSRRATGGRGTHKEGVRGRCGVPGRGEIPPGLCTGPGSVIYPISSSISEMSAKMRKTTSSVSAASIQLRNCSCMVGSRPPGPARAGARSWGWRAQLQAPEPPRAARSGADTLSSGRVRASGGGDNGRQGLLRRGKPASSLSAPARPSSPLPSPPFPPPRAGLRSQFDSFAPRLCSPPPTPVNSNVQPPAFASPAWFGGRWDVAGAGHSPPKEAGLWAPRASVYQAEPGEERAKPGVPCRLANALPRPLFVQCPRFLAKFSRYKDQHLGTAPSTGQGGGFSQTDVSAVDELEGVVGEGERRRHIQDWSTSAEILIAISGRGAGLGKTISSRRSSSFPLLDPRRLGPEKLPELPEVVLQRW